MSDTTATQPPEGTVRVGDKDLDPSSPEYIEAMAAKHDARLAGPDAADATKDALLPSDSVSEPDGQGDSATVDPMPDGGHEKFYNEETGAYDWSNHVKEVEYKLEQAKKKPAKDDAESSGEGDDASKGEGDSTEGEGGDANFEVPNLKDVEEAYSKTGEIPAAAKKQFDKLGLSDHLESYFKVMDAAQKNSQELYQMKAANLVGGESRRDAILQWAGKTLPEGQAQVYNTQLADANQWEASMLGLQALYEKSVGVGGEPNLVNGSAAPSNTGSDVYTSRRQVSVDMNNIQYQTDPVYRKTVQDKLIRSDLQE